MRIFPQILIAGASGLIGSALKSHWEGQSISCISLVRHGAQPNTPTIYWDPYQFDFREDMRRLNGVRAVVHLSGDNVAEGRWTQDKKQRLRQSRIRTTQSLVELLSRLDNRPEVLICASGVGYYGNRGDEIVTESSTPGTGFLAELCQDWEAASAAAANLGIRVIHLRFGIVLASEGGALKKMLPMFRAGLGGRIGSGRQWISWISLHDVVRLIDFCIDDQQLQGPVNAVAAHPVTNAEFSQTLARTLHRPAWFTVPAFALRLAVGEMADEALLSSTRAESAKLQPSGFILEHPALDSALRAILPE